MTNRLFSIASVVAVMWLVGAGRADAHCQIPCGIYDDELRFTLLAEDITTIEKSMQQITALSAEGDKNYNQLVRWVTNKEEHADRFQRTIAEYFLTQRIKPVDAADEEEYSAYQRLVTLCHQMLVEAMKSKQTTDTAHPARLRELLSAFREAYLEEHEHSH